MPQTYDPTPGLQDPFTMAYVQILKLLQAYQPLTNLVGLNNIESLANIRVTTIKDLLTSSDTNALKLLQADVMMKPFASNNLSVDAQQQYPLYITTDSLSIVPLNQLKWRILCALVRGGLEKLGLGDKSGVFTWALAGGQDSTMTPIGEIANAKRWAHVITVIVNFKFDITKMF